MHVAAETSFEPTSWPLDVSEAYWDFAFTKPELYQVMHGLAGVPFGQPETPPEARQTFALMHSAVQDGRGQRVHPSPRPTTQ